MNSIKGKLALVTGGGSGIGMAIVEELAAAGAAVCVHYLTSREPAEQLAAKINKDGGRAFAIAADLTDEAAVKEMFKTIRRQFDGLDILINNTGDIVGRSTLEGMKTEFYRKVMQVNLDTMMFVTREAIPMMKERGGASIVNLSSLAGRRGGSAGSLVYSSTKGAILAWTRSLATELAPFGIRVNAVAPGLILGSRFHAVHNTEEGRRKTIATIPLARAGNCADVARAVHFFASEYNGFITGATLDINGGVYAC